MMGQGGPVVGRAEGKLTIDTSQLNAAKPAVTDFAKSATRSLSAVDAAAVRNAASLNNVANTAKKTGLSMQSAATFAGSAFGGTGGALAGALAGGSGAVALGLAAREAIKLASAAVSASSDLQESINKTTVAFGSSDQAIVAWSKNSAKALGQSQQQALEATSSFGLLFATMNIGEGQSVKMSESLVELAADMASINNISPEEALVKLRAGLVGEAEPLRQVGVLLDEATVSAKALEMGLAPTTASLTQQDKVLARYQLILEQTALTQGDFARTSGGLANQQRILSANLKNLSASFGDDLYPGITKATKGLNAFLEAYQRYRQASKDHPNYQDPSGAFYKNLGDPAANRSIALNQQESATQNRILAGLKVARAAAVADLESGARPTKEVNADLAELDAKIKLVSGNLVILKSAILTTKAAIRDNGRQAAAFGGARGAYTEASSAAAAKGESVRQVKLDWAKGVEDLNQQTNESIINEEESFGQSRAKTIADYNKSVARDEASFALTRRRAEMDNLDAISTLYKEQGRREQKAAEDLARSMGQARADSAEHVAQLGVAHAERLGDLEAASKKRLAEQGAELDKTIVKERADSLKKLSEIETDYNKNEVKAQRDHADTLRQAAGAFDAFAVAQEDHRYAKAQADAKSAEDDALAAEKSRLSDQVATQQAAQADAIVKQKAALQEQIDQENESYQKSLAQEAASLAKSLSQQQAAFDLQQAEGRAEDAQRLEDMKTEFRKRKEREDEDHGIRVTQQAADQAAQLAAMDTAHGLRMDQIALHAASERDALQLAADDALVALKAANDKIQEAHDQRERVEEALWDKFHKHITDSLTLPPGIPGTPNSPAGYASGGFVPKTGMALLHAGEFVLPHPVVAAAAASAGGNRSMTMGNVSFTIVQQPGQSPNEVVSAIDQYLKQLGSPYQN